MNARHEPLPLQIVLDELRALRNDMRIELSAMRIDAADNNKSVRAEIEAALERADEAHERIDRYENRLWGWVIGAGSGGALTGATFGGAIRDAVKAFLS